MRPPARDGMPEGVAWTTRSIPRSSSGRPTRATFGASATERHARAAVLFTTTISAAPASARASTAALPAPPAPITPQRRPAGSKPSALAQVVEQARPRRQLSARIAALRRSECSRPPAAALGGSGASPGGRRRPCAASSPTGRANRSAAAPATALSSDPGGTSKATIAPVKSHGGIGGVVQLRRERMADREADHSRDRVVAAGQTTSGAPDRRQGDACLVAQLAGEQDPRPCS